MNRPRLAYKENRRSSVRASAASLGGETGGAGESCRGYRKQRKHTSPASPPAIGQPRLGATVRREAHSPAKPADIRRVGSDPRTRVEQEQKAQDGPRTAGSAALPPGSGPHSARRDKPARAGWVLLCLNLHQSA